MATKDVFAAAVAAMSTAVEVPLAGEIVKLDAWADEVNIFLDPKVQPAQALLAWLWWLPGARLDHRHAAERDHLYVHVRVSLGGVKWDVWSVFSGEDAALLCVDDHDNGEGPLSVHRLRQLQMRQTAALVAAR
jgi:hypothetical protein